MSAPGTAERAADDARMASRIALRLIREALARTAARKHDAWESGYRSGLEEAERILRESLSQCGVRVED